MTKNRGDLPLLKSKGSDKMLMDFLMICGICVGVPIVMIGGILVVEYVVDKVLNKFGK